MNRRDFTRGLAATPFALKTYGVANAALVPDATASISVDLRSDQGRIDRKIYGHFLEHLERVVYGGIFDPGSRLSDASGIRKDVVAAIQEMGGAHVLRWPGGNFASYYHWHDGIGPRAQRPARYDVTWKQHESNAYGTDEYLQTCKELPCEPFITVNMGDGTLREACEWVEYTRMQKRTPPVRIWGLGNEHYGSWQVGHYTASEYGRKAQQFAQFMRAVSSDLEFVGVGNPSAEWNEGVLRECGQYLDWLSVHLYSHRHFLDGEDDFDSSVAAPARFEQTMADMVAQLEQYERSVHREKPISICLEEWNGRHFRRVPGTPGDGTLLREDPRNIVDALFVAGVFHACQRMASRVTMTNYVFLLNAHGPLMVYPDGLLRTALFDVFRLYATLTKEVSLAVEVKAERFSTTVDGMGGRATTSRVDAAASRSVDGKQVVVSLINRYRDQRCNVALDLKGGVAGRTVRIHQMVAPSLDAVNTRANQNVVRSHSSELQLQGSPSIILPPASITHLEISMESSL